MPNIRLLLTKTFPANTSISNEYITSAKTQLLANQPDKGSGHPNPGSSLFQKVLGKRLNDSLSDLASPACCLNSHSYALNEPVTSDLKKPYQIPCPQPLIKAELQVHLRSLLGPGRTMRLAGPVNSTSCSHSSLIVLAQMHPITKIRTRGLVQPQHWLWLGHACRGSL